MVLDDLRMSYNGHRNVGDGTGTFREASEQIYDFWRKISHFFVLFDIRHTLWLPTSAIACTAWTDQQKFPGDLQ